MNRSHLQHYPSEWADSATLYTALGDEHRQKILMLFEPGESLSLVDIVEVMPLSRSAVMHHLKILRDAGAVKAWREGKALFYSLNKARFIKILGDTMDYLYEHPD